MNLDMLLKNKKLDLTKEIKTARHINRGDKENPVDIHQLYQTGYLDEFQSFQELNVFKGCKYILSFLALEKGVSLFIGAYEVLGVNRVNGLPDTIDAPYRGIAKTKAKYHYDLEKLTGFEDIEGRLIVNNVQYYPWYGTYKHNCEVIQMMPPGYTGIAPDYLDMNLPFYKVVELCNSPYSNPSWYDKLSSVKGIYLILDEYDGKMYIGAAYGEKGIWGRWRDYAKSNGTGGNKLLKEIIQDAPYRSQRFRFSILQVFPMNVRKEDIQEKERIWKSKLGSMSFGLNLN
ncbi:GIY-YIG nuclease family protein [Bacillus cereus]|uniref:GIY-YIG nuclease family protein n=1 Tax=Bacillus cereus TaxID=1396 RepID=UPI00283DE47B|nr:GIY-YIG nuclease family protein [Bacillus cereus]MDR4191482.1 GIY-YIG nuclease family protein [Bacillus cereus]MEB9930291.1 GIY-YIG nuclease family protein [Bacillus cereus]